MTIKNRKPTNGCQQSCLVWTYVALFLSLLIPSVLIGCGPSTGDLQPVEYTPQSDDDWKVSTPAEQGLETTLVAELYRNAAELETLYGLLVIKNDHLIAEGYLNEGSLEQQAQVQSVTKSYTSALVGIALAQGCLTSVDQKMLDFCPEFAGQISDPRRQQITIRDMLQMRSGYPWEETDPAPWVGLLSGDYLPLIEGFPLVSDPGTDFNYRGITSHLLGIIVARSCDTDLKSLGQEYLFSAIDAEVGDDWIQDRDGYYIGLAGIHSTARDMAKFGSLYLNNGEYDGKPVMSADWVKDSLQRYIERLNISGWFPGITSRFGYFRDLGYGYQWWSARAGDRQFNYAAGHGGQFIILLDELDMIIVTTADPFWQQHNDQSWKHESAIIELVGKLISSLPTE